MGEKEWDMLAAGPIMLGQVAVSPPRRSVLKKTKKSAKLQLRFNSAVEFISFREGKEVTAHATQRRQELVSRMMSQATVRAERELKASPWDFSIRKAPHRPAQIVTPRQLEQSFVIDYPENRWVNARRFEWHSLSRAEWSADAEMVGTPSVSISTVGIVPSRQDIIHVLKDHGQLIGTHPDVGINEELDKLIEDIRFGRARLMTDATRHKGLVRVVEVTSLRIWHGTGSNTRFLLRKAEKQDSDGGVGAAFRLFSIAKHPHENGMQAARRALSGIGIGEEDASLCAYTSEPFEESGLKLGIPTVVRKEIFELFITTTNKKKLARLGLGLASAKEITLEGVSLDGTKVKSTLCGLAGPHAKHWVLSFRHLSTMNSLRWSSCL